MVESDTEGLTHDYNAAFLYQHESGRCKSLSCTQNRLGPPSCPPQGFFPRTSQRPPAAPTLTQPHLPERTASRPAPRWGTQAPGGRAHPSPPLAWRGERKEELLETNLQNKGLISADRGTRATLMRTIPRSLFKSYTKDLLFPIFELVFQHRLRPL
jgi:hypothetical protein